MGQVAVQKGLQLGAVGAIMLPAALLLASMFICSIYFTFRDSFVTEPDPTLTATGDAP